MKKSHLSSFNGQNENLEKVKQSEAKLNPDQTTLAQLIRDILVKAVGAGITSANKEQLAEATANRIKQRHAEWSDYDVLGSYKKLEENDPEIQGLIADLMNKKRKTGAKNERTNYGCPNNAKTAP